MEVRFVNSTIKKEILKKIKDNFGIENVPYLLVEPGNKKVRGFSGTMLKEEIEELSRLTNIETVGLYLFKKDDFGWHISLDGTTVLKEQIKNNIIGINEEQLKKWLKGEDLDIEADEGYVVLKYKEDFFGCGKSTGKKIFNGVPKERRIKN